MGIFLFVFNVLFKPIFKVTVVTMIGFPVAIVWSVLWALWSNLPSLTFDLPQRAYIPLGLFPHLTRLDLWQQYHQQI